MASGRPDFSSTMVDVVLRRDWAQYEGREIRLGGYSDVAKAFGESKAYTSTPPDDEDWYFTHVSVRNVAEAAADADKDQFVEILIGTPSLTLYKFVCNGGGIFELPDTIKFAGGAVGDPQVTVVNRANHNTVMGVELHGYIINK